MLTWRKDREGEGSRGNGVARWWGGTVKQRPAGMVGGRLRTLEIHCIHFPGPPIPTPGPFWN